MANIICDLNPDLDKKGCDNPAKFFQRNYFSKETGKRRSRHYYACESCAQINPFTEWEPLYA